MYSIPTLCRAGGRAGAIALALLLLLAAPLATGADKPVVLIMGDSLSSGYRLPDGSGWVALLQERLHERGYSYEVVNASVPGETTARALRRLPRELERNRPAIVLIELGARDALADLPLTMLERNLSLMIQQSQVHGSRVALFEMLVPPELVPMPYPARFRATYRKVAKAQNVPLVPFFLRSIVTRPDAFLEDGIHPTAAVQAELLEAVWPHVRPMLRRRANEPVTSPRSTSAALRRWTAPLSPAGPQAEPAR